jgi:RNA polymerase sigma-70 factor (ECF subfamily)
MEAALSLPIAQRAATLKTAQRVIPAWQEGAAMGEERQHIAIESADWSAIYTAEYAAVARTVFLILHDRQRAEDITQDAFVQLYSHWRKVSKFDRPGAWVRRVAIRLAIRHQRRERVRAALERDVEPASLAQPIDVDLLRCIRTLPAAHRAAVALFYYEDRPVKEVASIMGWSEAATKVNLLRARQRLGKLLGEEVSEDVR